MLPGSNSTTISYWNSLGLDKIIHAFLHFVLVYFVSRGMISFHPKKNTFVLLLGSLLYSVGFGVGIEFLQSAFVPGRVGDFYDILSNVLGAIIAFGLFLVFRVKKIKN